MSRIRDRLRALRTAFQRRSAEAESWLEWIYPYRSLRLTRDGAFFLGVTFAIGLAALNTGHNLFYLIFAMLVSLIIVSGLLSERSVKHLEVERRLPDDVFARSPAVVEVRVRNRSRRRAAFAVEIREAVEGEPRRSIGVLTRLDPGAERAFHALWSFERRGRRRFRRFHLVTRFPFGFFEKTRIVPIPTEFLVFPAVAPDGGRAPSVETKRSPVRRDRLSEELLNLRPFLAEDDWRLIHWRVSARVGQLTVKEHGQALDRPLAIFFDNRGPAGEAFERAVEKAASLVWQGAREGARVDLYTFGTSFRGLGRDSLRRALAYLAEVAPATSSSTDADLARWREAIGRGAAGVFVTAGEAPALPLGTRLQVA